LIARARLAADHPQDHVGRSAQLHATYISPGYIFKCDLTHAAPRRALRLAELLRCKSVADPEVGVDVAPIGRRQLQLGPHLANQDVNGAVATRHLASPHQGIDLWPLDDAVDPRGQKEE